ncbi:MAG: ATP-binding protein [Gemmatimonadaceae bacterium]|jgi:hypothetical protein|nr:ATP-binding protein [Gemmatimonadaceae bacterium]
MLTGSGPTRRGWRSFRWRVLALSTLVVLPLTAPAFVRVFDRREAETRLLGARARELAESVARALDARVHDANTLLVSLSELLDPGDAPARNDAKLQRLFVDVPLPYSNLWIVDTLGRNLGAARLPSFGRESLSIADRRYFRDALAKRRFVTGEVVPSRVMAGAPLIVPFALPLIDPATRRVRAVVGASAAVDSLDAVRMVRTLPEGSVLTIVDSAERVVLRTRDHAQWAGRTLAEITGRQIRFHHRIGSNTEPARSADGTVRLVGYARMASTGWVVYLGLPSATALAPVQQQFRRDISVAVASILLVLCLAYLLTVRVVRPIEAVTADALAVAAGDEAHRSQVVRDDEIGDLARAVNAMADGAAQRRAALAESEARYRVLFDANPLPLLAWAPASGQITSVNDAAVAHFGDSRTQFLRRDVTSLVHPDDATAFAPHARTVPQSPTHCGVWRVRHADGRALDMELVLAPYRHPLGDQIIAVAIDITARRAAERALEESREQLRQSQKMEALGSFAGGIAHDFNNYLSSIIGYSELLAAQLTPDDPSRRDVAEILGAAHRAADLTRQILVFSRKQVVEAQVLDPADVVRGIERMLSRVMREDIAIVTSLAPEPAHVRIDQGQLEQVLVNLAANARDAMPTGGSFALATEQLRVRAPDAAHAGVPDGRYLVLSASDSGIGMPPEVRARVFEPFFTTKERGRGTGLGLSLVYSIVQQASGHIRVESAPGAGTTFSVYLPLVDAPRHADPVERRGGEIAVGTERILLVEDDPSVRAVTQHMLTRHGYDVTVAAGGHEALALLERAEAPFALVITDVVMPGMRGRELGERIRALAPAMRVLFVSGYADDDSLGDELHMVGTWFLAKPFTTAVLLRKVRDALDGAPAAVAVLAS